MADSSPYTTGASSSPDIPLALQQIYQQGFGMLGQQLATPYTPYQNARIADMTDLQRQAANTVGGLGGSLSDIYKNAATAIGNSSKPIVASSNFAPVSIGGGASAGPAYKADLTKDQMKLGTSSWTDPGVSAAYMSPYTQGVVDRIATLGQRNLQENLMPGVNSTFTGAGQFGSTRNADFANRALRDTQDSILGQQAQALESGYKTAGDIYSTDAARRLQAEQGTTSNLMGLENLNMGAYNAAQNAALQAAGINTQAATSQAQINAQLAQAKANQEFQAQLANQAGAQNQASQWMGLGSGMVGGLSQLANLQNTLGSQQQNLNQQNLNLAYQDYLQQQQYPMTNLQNVLGMANPIANAVTGKTVTNSYITPGVSGTDRVVGGIGALGQLAGSGALGKAWDAVSGLWS